MEHTRTDAVIQPFSATAPTGVSAALGAPIRAGTLPARHSVRAQVLTALRCALTAGDLLPGEVYSAPALAERYGVSATPVREAMQQLASEGIVEPVPNRGFRVAGLTARDLAELAEVRAALEVPALLRLARTEPPGCWETLRPLAEATVTAAGRGDGSAYAEADLAFHRAVLQRSGNRQLTTVTAELQRRAQCPTAGPAAPGPAELEAAALQHGALLDALACGATATVERIARDHFTHC